MDRRAAAIMRRTVAERVMSLLRVLFILPFLFFLPCHTNVLRRDLVLFSWRINATAIGPRQAITILPIAKNSRRFFGIRDVISDSRVVTINLFIGRA